MGLLGHSILCCAGCGFTASAIYTDTTAILKCGQSRAGEVVPFVLLKAKITWSMPVNVTFKIQFCCSKGKIVVCVEALVKT